MGCTSCIQIHKTAHMRLSDQPRHPFCLLHTGEMEALQEAIGTGSLDQAEMLGRLISRVAALEAAAADSAAQRRALHNQLVELRGNVRSPWMRRRLGCVGALP